MGRAMGVEIAGLGSALPDRLVTNEDLDALGCDSDWIVRRTGIRQRYHAGEDQCTSDLAVAAARAALDDAGLKPSAVDLILCATITPDYPTPSTACTLQRRLGAVAPAMDLSAACAGFVYGLVTAANAIVAGNANHALVIGADVMSHTIDPDDKRTYPLFGDGAGAAVVSTADAAVGLEGFQLGSEGDEGEMLCIPAGGTRTPTSRETLAEGGQYLRMDGRNVFKWAVRLVNESTRDVLDDVGWSPTDLDHLVLHQANARIIDSAVSDLGVESERVFMNLDRFGNTSAASIPIALDEMKRAGRLQPGQRLLLCGFGSGLAWGTAALQT